MWLSLLKGKVAVDYSLHASLNFSSWRWHIWSSPICSSSIPHRNYAARTSVTESRRVNSRILGISTKVGENIASGRLMFGSVRPADNKMAVMLGRNPLNSESFCRACGRSNIDGVQHGAFRRDSIKDFALRQC